MHRENLQLHETEDAQRSTEMRSDPMTRRSLIVGAAAVATVRKSAAQAGPTHSLSGNSLDIERFVQDVRSASKESEAQRAVEEVLQRAVSHPNGVMAGLGEPVAAGIHPIHRAPDLTILNVVWAPKMVLLPHNHNMWASIGIYTGREDNILWESRGDSVAAVGAASLSQTEVFGLPADAIHSVVNPIGRLTGAIHIYGGDFFAPGRSEWDAETLRERPWDLEAARSEFAKATRRFNAVP
jgi:predicted metal-dependent enzyme (double-stranded beta helix superfamily)